jgi:hypothetical protein
MCEVQSILRSLQTKDGAAGDFSATCTHASFSASGTVLWLLFLSESNSMI